MPEIVFSVGVLLDVVPFEVSAGAAGTFLTDCLEEIHFEVGVGGVMKADVDSELVER
jgi:hypothetical protein